MAWLYTVPGLLILSTRVEIAQNANENYLSMKLGMVMGTAKDQKDKGSTSSNQLSMKDNLKFQVEQTKTRVGAKGTDRRA